jgi:flagellar protein FliO/FliZ
MHIRIITIASYLFFLPEICFGESLADKNAQLVPAGSPMSFSYVIQILISFLIVIGVILSIAWFMKKTGRLGYGGGQLIKIKSSISLGMREKILVIEVANENIVVGVAPGQIRTLHVMGSDIEIEDQGNLKGNGGNRGFKQLIDKFSKQ